MIQRPGKPSSFLSEREPFMRSRRAQVVGYINSTHGDSGAAAEFDLLKAHGCKNIFHDVLQKNNTQRNRPQLLRAIDSLNPGDVLIICQLRALSDSTSGVAIHLKKIHLKGVNIKSLDGILDTSLFGKDSKAMFNFVLEMLASCPLPRKENSVIYNPHTKLQIRNLGGRPKTSKVKSQFVLRLRGEGFSYRQISDQTGLSVSTIRRIILEDNDI